MYMTAQFYIFFYWAMFVCLWKWTLGQFLCWWKESVVNLLRVAEKRVCFFLPSVLFSWHDHQAVGLSRIWVHQDNVWWVVHRLCLHSTCKNASTSEECCFFFLLFSSHFFFFFLSLPPLHYPLLSCFSFLFVAQRAYKHFIFLNNFSNHSLFLLLSVIIV